MRSEHRWIGSRDLTSDELEACERGDIVAVRTGSAVAATHGAFIVDAVSLAAWRAREVRS